MKEKNTSTSLSLAHAQTRAVREGQVRHAEGEHAEAMFLTSSYIFDSCQQAAARFIGEEQGNVYSRYTNPTIRNFEQRLAALEEAEDCIATSSGMAAIMSLCLAHLQSGDHIVCSKNVFGSTVVLLNNFFIKFGVEISYVNLTDASDWQAAIRPTTKLLFLESPSNPLNEIGDIAALAQLAEANGAILAVDNCFCSPALQQPLNLGAHIVIHSATKYIDGQGRCLGGAVLGRAEYVEPVRSLVRAGGPCMSAFNAWVFLKGLETLSLRMAAHSANALALAHWLEEQSWVAKVYFSGLETHPQHALASKQQSDFGGVLSFELGGEIAATKELAWQFIDATQLMSLTANLGDAKTTIVHPASTTHGRLTPEERIDAGISDGLIRIAVGLEHIDDLKADLLQARQSLL